MINGDAGGSNAATSGAIELNYELVVPESAFKKKDRLLTVPVFLDADNNFWVYLSSAPGSEINPAVVEAMSELGVDMSEEFPKPLTDEVVRAADVVITMGCGDACPIYPGKKYEDWQLDDPAGQELPTVRRIRDELDTRVQVLIGELLPDDAPIAS